MKSIKKILLGISIIMLGGVIANISVFEFIGGAISLVGIITSIIGYVSSDEKPKE